MEINKKRFFEVKEEPALTGKRQKPETPTKDSSQESLFVEDPDMELTAVHIPASQPTLPTVETQNQRNDPFSVSSQSIRRQLFKSQLVSVLGNISDETITYLYKKYFKQPNYIKLAVNEYLNGIQLDHELANEPQTNEGRNNGSLEKDTRFELDNVYSKIYSESQNIKDAEDKQSWKRFIGSINVQAWATRPTMRPLNYLDTLELRRLIPKNSKFNESSIIRIFTIPKTNNESSREIGRLPEDLTRILSPLLDLEIAIFDTTVIMTTKRRLSIGDSFYIQIDCFLKHSAFYAKEQYGASSQVYNGLNSVKRLTKVQAKSTFDFSAETEDESVLRLRQYSLSKLFERLHIRPTKPIQPIPSYEECSQDNTLDDVFSDNIQISSCNPNVISLDSDIEEDDYQEESKINPIEHLNLDKLKEFYQANNQSKLFNNLPETTTPPKSNFKLNLRQYQKHGLSWMLTRENEIDILEELSTEESGQSALSTQSKVCIREREEGIMNPLWKRYKWPKDTSIAATESHSLDLQSEEYFYANMYNGEMSLDKPLIKTMVKGGILADEMGLGKTISTLSLINSVPFDLEYELNKRDERYKNYASKTTLIVAPMSLLSQWKNEFDKANNNSNHKCLIYYDDSTETDLCPTLCNKDKDIPIVLITTYGTIVNEYIRYSKQHGISNGLPKTGLFSVKFFRIVLDEGHHIRNRSTKTAKAIYALSSSRKWVLTGTPIINRLDDLYSLVKFLELEPWSNFPYWKTFVTLPFEQKKIKQTLDVIRSILEPIFLRRTKSMKQKDGRPLVELPPKEVIIEEIKFNEREQKLYNWFKARASSSFQEGMKNGQLLKRYSQILTHILRLRQICCHVDLVGTANNMEEDLNENDQESSAVIKELKRFLESGSNEQFKDDTEIHSIMYSLYDKINIKESECSICTQSPIPLDEMAITHCGHIFCLNCLLEHIEFQAKSKKKPLCPNCREPVSKYKIFKIRIKDTSIKEIKFYTRKEVEATGKDYKFQLYLYDPNKTSSKIQALLRHLRNLKDSNSGEHVIVFSQFSSYLDIIENELKIQGGKDFIIYKFDGRLNMYERQKILENFSENTKNHDKITILLLSLKAGGVGLNLTTCSTAIMMDPWWSPNIEDQAIDRIHRIGQEKNVKVIRFIIQNSIETKMLKIQERKKRLGEAVGAEEEERRKRRIEEIQMLFEE